MRLLWLISFVLAIIFFISFITYIQIQPVDDLGCVSGDMVDYHYYFYARYRAGSVCSVLTQDGSVHKIGPGCDFNLHAYRGPVSLKMERFRLTGGINYKLIGVGKCIEPITDYKRPRVFD
jgi:hypothetical protein